MQVFIWGTGAAARCIRVILNANINLLGYIDNDREKQGEEYFGKQIFSPDVLNIQNFDYIIIGAYFRYSEISCQIESMGISADKIIQFFNCTTLMPLAFFYDENYIDEKIYQDIFTNYVEARLYYVKGTKEKLYEIECLTEKLNAFYDKKTSFREKSEFRVLQLGPGSYDLFDLTRVGFVCDSVGENDTTDVLKKILTFKPDAIISYDTTIRAREHYNHKNILYINNNDYASYIYLLPYLNVPKNEVILYNYTECHDLLGKLYGDNSIYQHIVYNKMLPGVSALEQQREIADVFDTDIVVVSASNSSLSRTKGYIEWMCWHLGVCGSAENNLREKIKDVLYKMLDIFYVKMDETGVFIEEESVYLQTFWDLMGNDLSKIQGIFVENEQYLSHLLYILIGISVYRRLIIKWIIEGGYKVELWGGSWENEPGLEEHYKGNIDSREDLAKVYNRSKISLFTNVYLGVHVSVFEMISSKSLCLAYHNSNTTAAALTDYFVDGESIVLYKNRQELLEKIDYYLKHMDKRKEIIERGYQIIKEQKLYWEYQFTEIIKQTIELAKENMDM